MRLKAVIGLLLVAVSIAGIYFWETKYRDKFTLEEALVASHEICEGDIVSKDDFKVINIVPNSRVLGSAKTEDIEYLLGMECIVQTHENEQIILSRFVDPKSLIPVDTRQLVIPRSWIFLSGNNIKTGDTIEAYYMPNKEFAGEFEISSITDTAYEIRCYIEDYFTLFDAINENNQKLLFVLKE